MCGTYKCWAPLLISSFCWKSECFWKVSSKTEISPVQIKRGLVKQVLTSGIIDAKNQLFQTVLVTLIKVNNFHWQFEKAELCI